MLEQLINFYKECYNKRQGLEFVLEHDKNQDWFLVIYHRGRNELIFRDNNPSLNILCAEAYIELKKWAREFEELEDIEINL